MRFYDWLNESLDNPVPFEWIHPLRAEFDINGKNYNVNLDKTPDDGLYISFDLAGKRHLTGTGDELKVFATVMYVVKDYMKRNGRPDEIEMRCSNPNRARLYAKIINKYLPEYKVFFSNGDLLARRDI